VSEAPRPGLFLRNLINGLFYLISGIQTLAAGHENRLRHPVFTLHLRPDSGQFSDAYLK
jgi:hypothetical protein